MLPWLVIARPHQQGLHNDAAALVEFAQILCRVIVAGYIPNGMGTKVAELRQLRRSVEAVLLLNAGPTLLAVSWNRLF